MSSILSINCQLSANERELLNILRKNGVMPRHKIVDYMDVSAQAIGQITKRLDQYKLLIHHKAIKVGLGQPPKPISINPDGAFSVGIKVGRRHTDVVLLDLLGVVRERHSMVYEFPVKQDLLASISEHLHTIQEKLALDHKPLVGIGVAAPFAIGGWHKLLGLSKAQAEEWNTLDLKAAIQLMTPHPVSLAKDTAAACIAELFNGQGRSCQSYLYIFVDTFVGGGVVSNGRWFKTAHENAGAIASVPMQLSNPLDQLLGHASLWELEQRLQSVGLDPTAAYDARALDPKHQAQSEAWVDAVSRSLAFTIVSGSAFLDVDAVVLDGSMTSELLSKLLKKTQEALNDFNWEGVWRPALLPGLIGSDAGALGGALLPLHENFYV